MHSFSQDLLRDLSEDYHGFDTTSMPPDSFRVENHTRAVYEGRIAISGLASDLISALGERGQLPLMEVDLYLDHELLYSKDFPGVPLVEMYSTKTGDEIYDRRAPFDSEYIELVQDWANSSESEPLSWMRISPTTKNMSRETKIEIGIMANNSIKVYILTIPFRKDQQIDDVFKEIKEVASHFIPNLAEAKNELTFLRSPVKLSPKSLRLSNPQLYFELYGESNDRVFEIDRLLDLLDEQLKLTTGIPYLRGRPLSEHDERKIYSIQQIIQTISSSSLIDDYVAACLCRDTAKAREIFYNIVNNFDRLINSYQSELDFNIWQNQLASQEFVFDLSTPVVMSAGCGAIGSSKIKSESGIHLELALNIKLLRSMGIFVAEGLPDFTVCGRCNAILPVRNGDPKTYWSICPFCKCSSGLDCHSC